MRELMVTTFVSLDGVMQAPGGPDEDRSDGFAYGGWQSAYWDDEGGRIMTDALSRPFDLLLGRRTYDIFASYWPTSDEAAVAVPFNRATKYVVSRGRPELPWETSVLIDGPEGIAALKETDGPQLQVHGSGDLVQTLLRHGLIDRLRVWTYPVLLGSGRRLFGEGTVPAGLRTAESTVTGKGVVIATYEPDGPVKLGSF